MGLSRKEVENRMTERSREDLKFMQNMKSKYN
jgi:hypothetical protein